MKVALLRYSVGREEVEMEARQETLSGLRELLRRAGSQFGNEVQDDYRRKPQHVDATPQNRVADGETAPSGNDWTGTLDLVLRAGESLIAGQERVRDLEAEVRDLSESASLEIQQLRAEVADLQRQLHEAEAGRWHAEDWLRRLTDAVRARFSPEQDSETPAAQAS